MLSTYVASATFPRRTPMALPEPPNSSDVTSSASSPNVLRRRLTPSNPHRLTTPDAIRIVGRPSGAIRHRRPHAPTSTRRDIQTLTRLEKKDSSAARHRTPTPQSRRMARPALPPRPQKNRRQGPADLCEAPRTLGPTDLLRPGEWSPMDQTITA